MHYYMHYYFLGDLVCEATEHNLNKIKKKKESQLPKVN